MWLRAEAGSSGCLAVCDFLRAIFHAVYAEPRRDCVVVGLKFNKVGGVTAPATPRLGGCGRQGKDGIGYWSLHGAPVVVVGSFFFLFLCPVYVLQLRGFARDY